MIHPRRRSHPVVVASATLALAAGLLLGLASVAATAGAQSGVGGSSEDPTATTSTLPSAEECGPGNIVRFPNCGKEPASATDPGGWLQVSMFYLICGAVIGIVGFLWWRSRAARRERVASGRDPLTLAKARGQGVRRNTRSEPASETSVN